MAKRKPPQDEAPVETPEPILEEVVPGDEPPQDEAVDEVQTPAHDTSPAAKAAHCAKCDRRFVPSDGAICPECVALELRRREKTAGYTWCRVLQHVVAVGRVEDGHLRTVFEPGDEAEFSDEDVLSLPDHFDEMK